MIKQLAHICIGAKDLAEAERFYCGLLGLKKAFSFPSNFTNTPNNRTSSPARIATSIGEESFHDVPLHP